jgi:protein-L-isoaspartate O-methyltransferase
MNDLHLRSLSSPERAQWLRYVLFPWLDRIADLGDDVLEIGPGPGLCTDLLRQRTQRLTAIEIDDTLAHDLAERLSGTNVEVLHADAVEGGLPESRFSGVTCISMLHHVPTAERQDLLFAQVARVLRCGGIFVGEDPTDGEFVRRAHEGDTFVPLDSTTLGSRLEAVGLTNISVELNANRLRFTATRP